MGKMILHNSPYEGISVTVDSSQVTANEQGRKVLEAGQVLVGVGASIFDDRSQKVKPVGDSATEADGILLSDVDVTDGDKAVSLVYRGTVVEDKCIGLTAEVKNALNHIQFVKSI